MLRAPTCGVAVALALLLAAVPARPAAAEPVPPAIASLQLINQERTRAGLRPLTLDPALSAVAAAHAADMVGNGYFGHISPRTGTPAARVRRAGLAFEAVGENLARHRTAADAHALLMGSPPHRATLLSPVFQRVGIAAVTDRYGWVTIVQVFLEPTQPVPMQFAAAPADGAQPGGPANAAQPGAPPEAASGAAATSGAAAAPAEATPGTAATPAPAQPAAPVVVADAH